MNSHLTFGLFIVSIAASPFPRKPYTQEEYDTAYRQLARLAYLTDEAHLLETPSLSLQSNMTDVTVAAGQPLTLQCNTVSTPASNIFWTLNGRLVQGTRRRTLMERIANKNRNMISTSIANSRFTIPCVDSSHNGRLACVADTGFATEKKHAVITVVGDAKCPSPDAVAPPRVTMWSDARYENIGNGVILMCRKSDRDAHTVWYNEDRVALNDMPGFVVLPNGDLYIPLLKWEMMGNYYCSVRNSEGEDRVESFLYPTDPNAPSEETEEEPVLDSELNL